MRNKAAKGARSNLIGPASFYGVRQNVSSKISNRKKFFGEEYGVSREKQQKKESIKIIKFT